LRLLSFKTDLSLITAGTNKHIWNAVSSAWYPVLNECQS